MATDPAPTASSLAHHLHDGQRVRSLRCSSTPSACNVSQELRSLASPGCLRRELSPTGAEPAGSSLAVYMVHEPRLLARRRALRAQLAALGARDVTWVECANREDVAALSPTQAACLFQGPRVPAANGTRSLALKHLIAYDDVADRLTRAWVSCAWALGSHSTLPAV